jgi:hypothetical protein
MSIKVCIITPASHLNELSSYGDCDMALSHLLVEEDKFKHTNHIKENYAKYFINRKKLGRWVILDNSAYEIGKLEATQATGQGLGPDLVLKAAEIINPSIVIAQDVLCDRQATLESTKAFIKYVKDKGLLGKFQLMAVPQGRTKEEWLESYKELYFLPEINQIGLSKISVPLSFGGTQAEDGCVSKARLKCTQAIQELHQDIDWKWAYGDRQAKPVHLLGGDNWRPWELKQQSKYSWIYSNDSSACIQYGIYGQKFDVETGQAKSIIVTKPDLENHLETTETLLDANKNTILHNIVVLTRCSK